MHLVKSNMSPTAEGVAAYACRTVANQVRISSRSEEHSMMQYKYDIKDSLIVPCHMRRVACRSLEPSIGYKEHEVLREVHWQYVHHASCGTVCELVEKNERLIADTSTGIFSNFTDTVPAQ